MDTTKKYAQFPKRQADSHKGTYGRLLCITGSPNMPGACMLSTTAALRCGAGLVSVATDAVNVNRLASAVPEAMWLGVDSSKATDALWYSVAFLEAVEGKMAQADAILIGCGLGLDDNSRSLAGAFLSRYKKLGLSCPVIIDADFLNILGENITGNGAANLFQLDTYEHSNWIFTPHPGEMARLSGKSTKEVQSNREESAKAFVEKHRGVLVLKGHETLVAQGEKIAMNPTGNPGMSRGGSGDVLAGMIAAFAAQTYAQQNRQIAPEELYAIACKAVYLHGLAGDIAAEQGDEITMLPRDMIAALPQAIQRCRQEQTDKG